MCRGAGGDFEGVLRSADLNLSMWTSAVNSTRQLLPYGKGGGFNRSAHSAGPGQRKLEMGNGEKEIRNGKPCPENTTKHKQKPSQRHPPEPDHMGQGGVKEGSRRGQGA